MSQAGPPATDLVALLSRLTSVAGASGYEDAVAAAVHDELAGVPGSWVRDGIGNLVLRLPAAEGAPSLMLMAHMDQVSLTVADIDAAGRLRCVPSGTIDERALLGSQVEVCTPDGSLPGVIGGLSSHLVPPQERTRIHLDELWVDVGATSPAQARALGVEVGAPVTPDAELRRLANGRLAGPAIDDRVGCAVLIELARGAAREQLDVELVLVWSVQEEVGARGARVAAQWIQPTAAIVVDTAPAAAEPAAGAGCVVGGGPAIRAHDAAGSRGTIYAPAIRRRLCELARERDIAHQQDVSTSAFTDACELHLAGRGVPTGGVFIPRLSSHTPAEIVDLRDLERTLVLLEAFVHVEGPALRALADRPLPAS